MYVTSVRVNECSIGVHQLNRRSAVKTERRRRVESIAKRVPGKGIEGRSLLLIVFGYQQY